MHPRTLHVAINVLNSQDILLGSCKVSSKWIKFRGIYYKKCLNSNNPLINFPDIPSKLMLRRVLFNTRHYGMWYQPHCLVGTLCLYDPIITKNCELKYETQANETCYIIPQVRSEVVFKCFFSYSLVVL